MKWRGPYKIQPLTGYTNLSLHWLYSFHVHQLTQKFSKTKYSRGFFKFKIRFCVSLLAAGYEGSQKKAVFNSWSRPATWSKPTFLSEPLKTKSRGHTGLCRCREVTRCSVVVSLFFLKTCSSRFVRKWSNLTWACFSNWFNHQLVVYLPGSKPWIAPVK